MSQTRASFPDPRILCALIDEYLGHKEKEWHTLASKFTETVTKPIHALIKRSDPILLGTKEGQRSTHTPEEKRQICKELKNSFQHAAATEERDEARIRQWVSIIRTLGLLARQAQNEKTSRGDSDFCWTLHAIRSYIILCIDPYIFVSLYPKLCTEQDRRSAAEGKTAASQVFEQILGKRQNDVKTAEEDIHALKATSTSTENADIELNKILFDLANLGDMCAAIEATKRGVFSTMELPATQVGAELSVLDISLRKIDTTHNPYLPYCYQPEFFKGFFERFIQQRRMAANMVVWPTWETFLEKVLAGQYSFNTESMAVTTTQPAIVASHAASAASPSVATASPSVATASPSVATASAAMFSAAALPAATELAQQQQHHNTPPSSPTGSHDGLLVPQSP